jgi:hypothetical protein
LAAALLISAKATVEQGILEIAVRNRHADVIPVLIAYLVLAGASPTSKAIEDCIHDQGHEVDGSEPVAVARGELEQTPKLKVKNLLIDGTSPGNSTGSARTQSDSGIPNPRRHRSRSRKASLERKTSSPSTTQMSSSLSQSLGMSQVMETLQENLLEEHQR